MKKPMLWIALTRPDNLVLALAAAGIAREAFSACHLIHEDSGWWERAHWDEYRDRFDGIHLIDKIPTCRGLRDLPRFYRQINARQQRLAALRVGADDVIFTLAGITGLSNALASAYPHVAKIFGLTLKKYLDASRPADFLCYRFTTSGWLQNHLLEPMAGVGRTLHLKPWRRVGGDGVRLERLERPLEAVFQAILILSNTGRDLPPAAGPRLRPAPFPSLRELSLLLPEPQAGSSERRRVVFFGTPFLLVHNLPPERYAARLNEILDYLRQHYRARCQLIYRPHPAETHEREHLRLEDFTYEDDQEVAELYFLKHAPGLEAVYSVSSTVSRVAFNYGLNAYALWRCFPFAASAATYFETLMGTVPDGFEVRSLDTPPVAYMDRLDSSPGHTFTAALTSTLAEVTR